MKAPAGLLLAFALVSAPDGLPAEALSLPPEPPRTGDSPLPPQPPTLPPRLPPAPTPIDRLRALLALDVANREKQLAERTPAQRQYLEAQLAEFDRLSPAERELRLQLLTVRHHLLPLLRTPLARRAEELRQVPSDYRGLIQDRLAAWDKLTPDQQQAMLQSESIFAGLALTTRPAGVEGEPPSLPVLSPDQRRQIEQDLARWQARPAEERERITRQFQAFLSLSEREQQKTLARLDPASRERVARLVEGLEQLPPGLHGKSVEALKRFQALPASERERFLRNAARWRAMSPEERSAWRRLITELPPAPPGFGNRLLPPLPEGVPPPPGAGTAQRRPRRAATAYRR